MGAQLTIADTIKSLKPGDRVRVTREQTILEYRAPLEVAITDYGENIRLSDPTITSIEVIEPPLQVGDRVHWFFGDSQDYGVLLAIDEDKAWIKWDNGVRGTRDLSALRRAS